MNIGFYILDISANNAKHQDLLNCINQLCERRPFDNIVLFNNKFDAIDVYHKYYTLHISEAKYFKGILFVFDVKSAMVTKTFPAPKKQFLYVDKAEWSDKKDVPYTFWASIYNNIDFELISANEELNQLCDICWKTPVNIIEKFNGKDIDNIIKQTGLE